LAKTQPGFDAHAAEQLVDHLERHDLAEHHHPDRLEGQHDHHDRIVHRGAVLRHLSHVHAPGQQQNRAQRAREFGVLKRTQQLDRGGLATLLAIVEQLDHGEDQSADHENRAEDLREVRKCGEIAHRCLRRRMRG